nr:hypothetical protein [Tanacetum cinerariifolium]
MSSASSAVTYTSVYTDSELGRVFWGADEELSDRGSPRVIVYGYDGLPMLPVSPPSPDYIQGLEEPQTPPALQNEDEHELMFIQPHDPDFPLQPVVSHTAESPGYVAESDPEKDLEEYKDDETEDGPVDHPMDRGDDDGDSSGYDANDEDEDEEDDKEEDEHLAPTDSAVVIPIDELVSLLEGTKPIIPPPSTDSATSGARITIRSQTSISLLPETKVERLLAMPTPLPSPFTSLSPPSAGEHLARCTASAALPSPPLPPSLYPPPPSLYPPPPVDRRNDIPESEWPPRKRLYYGFFDTIKAEMRHRGIGEVGYGIRDTWIDPTEVIPEMAPTTLEKVNTRVTKLAEFHEHDTQDLYALMEDAQDGRTRISQRVAMDSQRVDLLMGDRMTLQETVWIVEEEAYAAREAWAHSVGLSQTVHHELQTLREQVYMRPTLRYSRQRWQDSERLIRPIMAPMTRQRQNPPPPNTDTPPQHITLESVQAMIDQALLRKSTNGDGSQSSHEDNPRHMQTTRPCFYANFMKCHPLNFKGNEGVVGLTRWIEKMESVFIISGCAVENQVKFGTCTLLDATLTWWNGQIRTLGPEAYAMTWEVKGNDVPTYTNHFQELTLICTKFVANENEKIDTYISGLLDRIYGNVKYSKPRTLDETIELTNDLMDQKLHTYAERADNKRKANDTSRNNHGHQQQPFKKQNVTKVYNMGMGERKSYEGSLPKCTKYQRHRNGPCTQKCHKCNKVGHFARDCRSSRNANVANAQRYGKETPKGNGCFECGASRYFKRNCPKLRNKNEGNRNAQRWVYVVGNAEKNGNAPMNTNSNVVTGTFFLNNRYASILFDTGVDRSFISTAFSSLNFCFYFPQISDPNSKNFCFYFPWGWERGNHMKDLFPSAQSANVITMARVPKSATNATRHFKRNCPKLRNKNGGNRNAQRWVYVVRNAEKNENAPMNPDSNVVTVETLQQWQLNNSAVETLCTNSCKIL